MLSNKKGASRLKLLLPVLIDKLKTVFGLKFEEFVLLFPPQHHNKFLNRFCLHGLLLQILILSSVMKPWTAAFLTLHITVLHFTDLFL